MSERGRKAGEWTKTLTHWLERRRAAGDFSKPIPASRELAESFGVTHSTVFRQLKNLESSGILWRAENGRRYFAEARAQIEKPRPVACLLRRIESWSALYQELMEGIARTCERQELGSLLWHEEELVRQDDPASPPIFATNHRQILSLRSFCERYGDQVSGVILDHAWSDAAIASLPSDLRKRVVVLGRPGPPDFPSFAPDYRASAQLALAHLAAAGYRKFQPVRPFPGDPSVEYCLNCLETAAKDARVPLEKTLSASTRAEKLLLMNKLRREKKPCAVLFPEDNAARLFLEDCRRAGLRCPDDIGILSLQGTRSAAEGNISHLRTDYGLLGETAASAVLGLSSLPPSNPPELVPSETTLSGMNADDMRKKTPASLQNSRS